MDNDYINSLRKSVKREFTEDKARYRHSIGVANTAACLAMRYEVSMEAAYIAGLLHDCAKCLSDEELLLRCRKYNIPITEYEKQSPYLLHGKLGAFYAKERYNIDDEDICSAIKYHTTGRAGMSPLEEILFIADYMEPLRNKAADLDEVRKLVFVDIKKAVYVVTKDTLEYLKSMNKPIDPQTVVTYEYYKNIID